MIREDQHLIHKHSPSILLKTDLLATAFPQSLESKAASAVIWLPPQTSFRHTSARGLAMELGPVVAKGDLCSQR